MKDVVIDNSKKLVMVNGKVIPRLLLSIIRGAIGKSFVVKRYRGGRLVVTRFPDMSGIVATEKQKVRRDLFREAVVFAKWIIADEGRKLAFKNTLPRKKRRKVYQAALQLYIREKGNKVWLRKVIGMLEVQGIEVGLGVSRHLAVMAVVESGRSEMMRGMDVFEQQGPWRVMWWKRKENWFTNTHYHNKSQFTYFAKVANSSINNDFWLLIKPTNFKAGV